MKRFLIRPLSKSRLAKWRLVFCILFFVGGMIVTGCSKGDPAVKPDKPKNVVTPLNIQQPDDENGTGESDEGENGESDSDSSGTGDTG